MNHELNYRYLKAFDKFWFRIFVAFIFAVVLYFARWDVAITFEDDWIEIDWGTSRFPFDFQIWRASDVVADSGVDPYDEKNLFREIGRNNEEYGGYWEQRADSCVQDDQNCMYLFNPPTWLTQLKLFGPSVIAMNLAGLACIYGSILWLSRKASNVNFLAYIVATTLVFTYSAGNITFQGQVGFLIAGLVGLRFVFYGTNFVGFPIAMLSFKPHISLASGISELWRQPEKTALRVAVPLGSLLFATAALYPFSFWLSWLDQLNIKVNPVDDMTFSTLSATNKLPDWTDLYLLLFAFIVVALVSWLLRYADPYALALWALAMITFFSGHGYSHDWLWLIFIPILRKWSWHTTMIIAVVFCFFHKIGWESAQQGHTKQTFSILSLLALAAVIYTGFSVVLSHFQHKETLKKNFIVMAAD